MEWMPAAQLKSLLLCVVVLVRQLLKVNGPGGGCLLVPQRFIYTCTLLWELFVYSSVPEPSENKYTFYLGQVVLIKD